MSDGDINLNIDAHGRVISWGSSFHPGDAPSLDANSVRSTETSRLCTTLENTIDAHKTELIAQSGSTGAWGLVKSAAQVILPGLIPDSAPQDSHAVAQAESNIAKTQQHYDAICNKPTAKSQMMYPVDALLHLLPRIHPDNGFKSDLSADDFSSMPQHHLTPKPAPAEPATEIITGPGLAKAGVVSDIPARLMYTQTSDGEPRMVWKFEVEMKDSWYEAYVDVQSGDLLRIVDWANDYTWHIGKKGQEAGMLKGGGQKPLPAPPKKVEPYTYQIFPWGASREARRTID